MRNISQKKIWLYGAVNINVYPPPIKSIQIKVDMKSEKYYDKIKLRINTMLKKSEIYELKTALFYNGAPEDFLLLQQNYKIRLGVLGTLTSGNKSILM